MNFVKIQSCLDRINDIHKIPDQDRMVLTHLGEIEDNLRNFLKENSSTKEEKLEYFTPGGP